MDFKILKGKKELDLKDSHISYIIKWMIVIEEIIYYSSLVLK